LTKRERNALIFRQYNSGYSQSTIGEFYNLSQSRVSAIVLSYQRGEAEIVEERRGSKPRLTESDLKKLSELMSSSEEASDFVHWNKWRIKELIKEEFDVEYHENYIWEIMKKIGFTSQRPQKKDYRQSTEKVADFKTKEVGAIKKIKRGK